MEYKFLILGVQTYSAIKNTEYFLNDDKMFYDNGDFDAWNETQFYLDFYSILFILYFWIAAHPRQLGHYESD